MGVGGVSTFWLNSPTQERVGPIWDGAVELNMAQELDLRHLPRLLARSK